jgi:hypothetical protein
MKTSILLEIWASWTISLGTGTVRACMRPDLRRGLAASDRERPSFTEANGTLMARRPTADLARSCSLPLPVLLVAAIPRAVAHVSRLAQ